jgi:hypothetical protein
MKTHRTADMIPLGIELTRLCVGDYWDDVDGYMRNTLVEQQFTNTEYTERLLRSSKYEFGTEWSLGGFSCGGLTALDNYMIACCTGNGSQAL